MPVDPVIQTLLDAIEAMGAPAVSDGPPERARAAFRRLTVDLRQPSQVVEVGEVADATVDGAVGPRPARVYRPADGAAVVPTVLFLHGGGFVIGDLDTHDNQARAICAGTGAVVVSVDYRLAPEHRWPAAAEDAVAALGWLVDHAADLGGDPARVGVAGDSAGGNLAAVAALAARERGWPLAAQLLVYPGTDFVGEWPSRRDNGEGFFLTHDDLVWFGRHYLGADEDTIDPETLSDPWLSPLRADLAGLAPAVVVTAEFDPLRDEGDAFARALAAAGVEVDHLPSPGMIHGYFDMFTFSPAARAAVDAAVETFARRLGSPVPVR
jgi:acetyl esterase